MRPLINPIRVRSEQEYPLVEARVNGGMVTAIDAADIENNQFQDVKNWRIRDDKTTKRFGYTQYSVVKPNANKVMLVTTFKRFAGTTIILRLTPSTVHIFGAGVWFTVAGALTGGVNDRFSTAVINDRFFFANGVDNVKELNVGALTFGNAGNWEEYKYITGSFNRIVGANLKDSGSPNPVKIGWSGDLNFLETNPAVDFSAGFEFLAESPSDYADFITGLVGFPAMLIIPKERSIWGGIKQPSASNPFQFQTIIPGIGCDCPYSVQKIPNGIAWVDTRTAAVYTYIIGDQVPTPIGRSIERTLMRQITDLNGVFSDYNGTENEYSICIPSLSSNTVKVWTYNFRNKTWLYDEMELLSTLNTIDYSSGVLSFDDLAGSFDSLVGDFNSLVNPSTSVVTRIAGRTDGEILFEEAGTDKDAGVSYSAVLASKRFNLPSRDIYFNELRIEYTCTKSGSFEIQYKKQNSENWITAKTITAILSTQNQLATFKKNILARQIEWRIVSTAGLFEILEYEVMVIPGARSTR